MFIAWGYQLAILATCRKILVATIEFIHKLHCRKTLQIDPPQMCYTNLREFSVGRMASWKSGENHFVALVRVLYFDYCDENRTKMFVYLTILAELGFSLRKLSKRGSIKMGYRVSFCFIRLKICRGRIFCWQRSNFAISYRK